MQKSALQLWRNHFSIKSYSTFSPKNVSSSIHSIYCIPYMAVNVDFLPYMEVNVGKKEKRQNIAK